MRMCGLSCLLVLLALKLSAAHYNNSKLVAILVDGFRWDYVPKNSTLPGFELLRDEGAIAKWVNPLFPSYSSPGWLTFATGIIFVMKEQRLLSTHLGMTSSTRNFVYFPSKSHIRPGTGLYPENHQMLGNIYQDPSSGAIFNVWSEGSISRASWWRNAEPLWVTATKMGILTSVYSWGRCEIEIDGIRPAICEPFHPGDFTFRLRSYLRRAIYDLRNGFRLVMIRSGHVDRAGHQFGPESALIQTAITDVDTVIASFLKQIKDDVELNGTTNVVVASSHGMTASRRDSDAIYYRLEDFVAPEDIRLVLDRGAVLQLLPRSGQQEKVVKQLRKIPNVNVYTKEEIPEWYHYRNSKYVQGVLLVAFPGTVIEGLSSPKQHPRDLLRPDWPGLHGYGPFNPDMRGICMAWGPGRGGSGILEAVDVYRLLTDAVGIPPLPNNSSWERVGWMLGSAPTTWPCPRAEWPLVWLLLLQSSLLGLPH